MQPVFVVVLVVDLEKIVVVVVVVARYQRMCARKAAFGGL